MKRLLCALLLSAPCAPLNIYSVDSSAEPMFGITPHAVRPIEVTGTRG